MARLEQGMEISSSVKVGMFKSDLEKMCRDSEAQMRREKKLIKNFMKSSIKRQYPGGEETRG